MPGWAAAGPATSSQHAVALAGLPPSVSDSSKVTSSRPSFLNAGELVIFGTQVWRNVSMLASAEGLPCWLTHGASWPSLHRLGVMKLKLGVVDTDPRSVARPVTPDGVPAGSAPVADPSGTTWLSQAEVSSMIEWKYTKGSWRVAYPSPGTAASVRSGAPTAGWPQTADSREGMLPMSSMYPFQVRWAWSSWLATVVTVVG